jgi:multidrug efflux pump subunit AcrA (membrane-fusion protein)
MESRETDVAAQDFQSTTSGLSRYIRLRVLIRAAIASGVVAAAAVAVVYFVVLDDADDTTGELLEAPVTLGNLVDSISSDGTIVFPERSVMSFGSAGTVEEVLVEIGDSVSEGQELARLDPLTTSNLAADVEEARSALEDAAEKLDDAVLGATDLSIAKARAAVTDAQDDVDALLAAPTHDVLVATSAVAKADLAVSAANETLADLNALLEPQAVADAEAERILATASYDGAVANKSAVEQEWDTNIDDANTALRDAQSSYITKFEGWFGVTLTGHDIAAQPADILTGWGATYESIFERDISASFSADVDDPLTPWNEFTVSLWTKLFPFGVNPTCDTVPSATDSPCVQHEVESARTAVTTAEDALAQTSPDRAAAITAALKAITTAENAKQDAAEATAFSTSESTVLQIQSATVAVSLAEIDLTDANAALTSLTDPTPEDTAANGTSLAIAQAELSEAQDHLTNITTTDQTLIALRASEKDVASAQLDRAISLYESAVLKSPVNGIVDAVNFSSGDEVQRNAAIVEIIDQTIVTIEMDIAQVDILAVAVGAQAALTLDALPGQNLIGAVTDIGPASGGQTGSVTFPVVVTVQVPQGVLLLEGLTANAEMITSTRSNVLLIPSVAVGGSFSQPTVDVFRDGQMQTVNVSLDGGNETFAVIGSGVVEGDTVLFRLPGVTDETNPFAVIRAGAGGFTGGFTRTPGGGGGNGGFGGGGGGGGGRQAP